MIKKNGDHIDLIERVTSDCDNLRSPDKVNSQNVMDSIMDEHEINE